MTVLEEFTTSESSLEPAVIWNEEKESTLINQVCGANNLYNLRQEADATEQDRKIVNRIRKILFLCFGDEFTDRMVMRKWIEIVNKFWQVYNGYSMVEKKDDGTEPWPLFQTLQFIAPNRGLPRH